jgi:hypothetical protein
VSGIFGLGKDFQNYLEKVFFFILSGVFFIRGFLPNILRNGPSER